MLNKLRNEIGNNYLIFENYTSSTRYSGCQCPANFTAQFSWNNGTRKRCIWAWEYIVKLNTTVGCTIPLRVNTICIIQADLGWRLYCQITGRAASCNSSKINLKSLSNTSANSTTGILVSLQHITRVYYNDIKYIVYKTRYLKHEKHVYIPAYNGNMNNLLGRTYKRRQNELESDTQRQYMQYVYSIMYSTC